MGDVGGGGVDVAGGCVNVGGGGGVDVAVLVIYT